MSETKKCLQTVIALSVPHAYCPTVEEHALLGTRSDQGHWCDVAAHAAARQLEKAFQQHVNKFLVRVFASTTPRLVCDLNRPTCKQQLSRETLTLVDRWLRWKKRNLSVKKFLTQEIKGFRKPIQQWIQQQATQPTCAWLLDIHSFYHDAETFDGQNRDLVLLDNHPDMDKFYPYTVSLNQFLQKQGIDSAVLKGSTKGYGRNENNLWASQQLGVRGVFLLEFNERLTEKQCAWICRAIVQGMTGF